MCIQFVNYIQRQTFDNFLQYNEECSSSSVWKIQATEKEELRVSVQFYIYLLFLLQYFTTKQGRGLVQW